ncbi:helix-turn-helix domain-containing protein [Streptomyces sp. NPDC055078]
MKPQQPNPTSGHAQLTAHELRARYEDGATIRELQSMTGISHGTVWNRLRDAGTVMRSPYETRRMRMDPRRVSARRNLAKRLRTLYENGATIQELTEVCRRSDRTVRRLLAEADCPPRTASATRRLRSAAARQQLMDSLQERYEAGEQVVDLAAESGRSESTIYRLLRQAAASRRTGRGSRRLPDAHESA